MCRFPIRHDALEVRRVYFSVSAVFVQNERATTDPTLEVAKGGDAVGQWKG